MIENEIIAKSSLLRQLRKTLIKPPVIMFMAYDRDDNNKFTANMTNGVLALDRKGKKINIPNLSKETGYSKKEIEINLYEIQVIMDSLGIE